MAKLNKITVTTAKADTATEAEIAAVKKAIRTALKAEGVEVPCEINVLLTGDAGIKKINREMRDIDASTDVLSFPMFDYKPGHPPKDDRDADPETGLIPLGDMVISMMHVRKQAKEYGHSEKRELCYLAVHSVLHLLGYDHLDEGKMKKQMRGREEAILEILNQKR